MVGSPRANAGAVTRALAAAGVLGLTAVSGHGLSSAASAQPAPAKADVAVAAAEEPADPLTPPRVDAPPPIAPGAPVQAAAPAPVQAEPDPAIAALLRIVAQTPGAVAAHAREDRGALAAFYAENGGQPVWTTKAGYSARATTAIGELQRAGDFGLDAGTFGVAADIGAFATPAAQADAELAVGLATLKYARHARGGRVDPAAISRMIDMKPRLFEPKSVLVALAASEDTAATLRRFHPQHAGFERLRSALVEARKTPASADTVQRILVNLERWRWMPDDLGAFHVLDNVPEQLTRVFKDGAVVLTEKIVVGKPNTPTPVFSANMQFVIFHPSWGVPEGIKSNELGPLLRRASGGSGWFGDSGGASRALARHQLRVSYNGREVNPDSVDWSKADVRQYQFSQPPSGSNVLGVVKFRFPNRFDVYMHDTPERHLFNGTQRAFSHGCMRVQNPVHLAEVLLGHDKGWSAEKVRGMVKGGSNEITLTTQIPVHVTYFTASVDETGKLALHGDLYGMDGRVASALAGKPVAMAAAAAPKEGEPAAERRRPGRVAQSRKGAQKAEAPFNPFSGLFGN